MVDNSNLHCDPADVRVPQGFVYNRQKFLKNIHLKALNNNR